MNYLRDFREVYLAIGECLHMGNDPYAWRIHFATRMCEILEADVGLFMDSVIVAEPTTPHWMRVFSFLDVGWKDEAKRAAWWEIIRKANPDVNPTVEILKRNPRPKVAAYERALQVNDNQWYASEFYRESCEPIDMDDALYGYVNNHLDWHQLIWLQRAKGRPKFTARHRHIMYAACLEIRRYQPSKLADLDVASIGEIPLRMRQVLGGFLQGLSEKQVAAQMGISVNTVHTHAKRLYERAGVNSRAELLNHYRYAAPILAMLPTEESFDQMKKLARITRPPWPEQMPDC